METPNIMGGAAGLLGRTPIPRPAEFQTDDEGHPILPPPAKAIPAKCLQILNSPRHRTCLETGGCNGLQRDGRCIAEIVATCRKHDIDWQFQAGMDRHGNWEWTYVGPPLPPIDESEVA